MFFHKKNRYELDMTTANNALQNILSTCNQPVNTIPFDKLVLRKKVNAASYNRLIVATAAVGGAGAVAAMVPFVSSMLPSERAKAAGAPVEVDVGSLAPGQMITVEWRGKPVWVLNRTPEMLDTLPKLDDAVADPKSEVKQQPDYCRNATRSIKPNILIAVGICTHLGCSPSNKFKKGSEEGMTADWLGGQSAGIAHAKRGWELHTAAGGREVAGYIDAYLNGWELVAAKKPEMIPQERLSRELFMPQNRGRFRLRDAKDEVHRCISCGTCRESLAQYDLSRRLQDSLAHQDVLQIGRAHV